MTRLFRMCWVQCKNLDVMHSGPILYLTERKYLGKRLRPYTEEEAQATAERFNRDYTEGFHEVWEVT